MFKFGTGKNIFSLMYWESLKEYLFLHPEYFRAGQKRE